MTQQRPGGARRVSTHNGSFDWVGTDLAWESTVVSGGGVSFTPPAAHVNTQTEDKEDKSSAAPVLRPLVFFWVGLWNNV